MSLRRWVFPDECSTGLTPHLPSVTGAGDVRGLAGRRHPGRGDVADVQARPPATRGERCRAGARPGGPLRTGLRPYAGAGRAGAPAAVPRGHLVGFLVREHGDPPAFLGTPPFGNNPLVLGHAWPRRPRRHRNPSQATSISTSPHVDEPDRPAHRFQAAAVHEIGHALGLGHTTTDTDSVMTASGGDGRRELSAVDIEAVQKLYRPIRWPRDATGGC
ncbi:matrixin family metalloprotease [Streptomyces sp. NPDC090445]|uniref:matrixin family metalloprotease n=1 Tax=Streptomyces sp. NPDC090445 TaxID=3365963 RepID=UPI0037FBFE58